MTEKVKNQSVVLPTQKVIKKKYSKPDFEVIELKMEAPLLMGSGGGTATAGGQGSFGNGSSLSGALFGSNE